MDYKTRDFYFQIVSGEIGHLYEDAEDTTPAPTVPPHIKKPIERDNWESSFIPVPELSDRDHRRYLDPLELDGLLATTVSEQARKYEFSTALHIWQDYHGTDCSEHLKEVLQMVWICYRDLADKYGLSDVMQLDGGSAATITEEPAGSVAAAAEDPRHDVPADWPEMLRTDKAIKLAYELEKLGYLNEDWQPGPKLYFESSGSLNTSKASYVAQKFRDYLKKGQSYSPVFTQYWNANIDRTRKGQSKPISEIDDIVAKLNR